MPLWTLVIMGSIALGYILQIARVVKDKIPLLVIPFAVIVNVIIEWDKKGPQASRLDWTTKRIVAGMTFGFIAWVFHRAFMRQLEERIPWLKGATKEAGLNGDEPPPPTQGPTPPQSKP
jgi:hypothetical protein